MTPNERLEHDRTAANGYTSVEPWVVTDNSGGYSTPVIAACGGRELSRVALADDSIGRAEIRVGDTVVPAFDRDEDWLLMSARLPPPTRATRRPGA
jgi:PhnB protein